MLTSNAHVNKGKRYKLDVMRQSTPSGERKDRMRKCIRKGLASNMFSIQLKNAYSSTRKKGKRYM